MYKNCLSKKLNNIIKIVLIAICICSISACARKSQHDQDPFESINRGIYNFNKGVDNLYLRPVAHAYRKVVPPPVRDSFGNFIQNINEIPTSINDILQGKVKDASKAIFRLAINSTFGVFGLFDVASELGVKRHTETLANTFVRWGYKKSNYLVIPFLGPSTFRDAVGLAGNTLITPSYHYFDHEWRTKYYVANSVHTREGLLDLQEVIDAAASVDEYAFIRDAYFQKRANLLEVQGEISKEDEKYLEEPPE